MIDLYLIGVTAAAACYGYRLDPDELRDPQHLFFCCVGWPLILLAAAGEVVRDRRKAN